MTILKSKGSKIKFSIGVLSWETNWEVDDIQRNAAWEMYIELVTRITTAELQENEGMLREALFSYHKLFEITREILKKYGAHIATPANPKDTTFGHVAINVLNRIVRPVLAKWHPLLLDWEQQKPAEKTVIEHEHSWHLNSELRTEINKVRKQLIEYANILGYVSGVADLIEDSKKEK